MPWSDPTDKVCALVEVLHGGRAHHGQAALEFRQFFPGQNFVRSSWPPCHGRESTRFVVCSPTRQGGTKHDSASTPSGIEKAVAIDQAVAIEKQIADAKINHMAHEAVTIITQLGRMVKVRLEKKGDDVWDTTIVYGKQIHRVGKFQGRDRAMEASKKKAVEVADVISANPAMLDEDDRKREKKYKKRKSVP